MRQIQKGDATLNVVAHVILKNFWEYYITELPDADGIGWALVVGDCTELAELMPPPEWKWCSKAEVMEKI